MNAIKWRQTTTQEADQRGAIFDRGRGDIYRSAFSGSHSPQETMTSRVDERDDYQGGDAATDGIGAEISSDDGSEDDQVAAALVAYLLFEDSSSRQRRSPIARRRLIWPSEADRLLREGQFEQVYRVSPRMFERLCEIIAPAIALKPNAWTQRGNVTVENKLQMTLRFLAGGAMQDVRRISGVGKRWFYECIYQVIDAICDSAILRIEFPASATAREQAAAEFKKHSRYGIMQGCVGALDGWLCSILAPPARQDGPGPRAYYSGHYSKMGINVQACVDAYSRFIFVSCDHPGGVNDARAYSETKLPIVVEALERGLYVVGDNAYVSTNKLLTPFTGVQVAGDLYKDSFNFALSQLRIRVEMAFGLLVSKWGIFDRPLSTKLERTTAIIKACMILHNFTICERLASCEDPARDDCANRATSTRTGSVTSILGYDASDLNQRPKGTSFVRDGIVGRLRAEGIIRPYQP
jgi:hypothetical protein